MRYSVYFSRVRQSNLLSSHYYHSCYAQGGWLEGKRHGKGLLITGTGDTCEGEFWHDLIHGQCIYTHSNGDRYEGSYVKGIWS